MSLDFVVSPSMFRGLGPEQEQIGPSEELKTNRKLSCKLRNRRLDTRSTGSPGYPTWEKEVVFSYFASILLPNGPQ